MVSENKQTKPLRNDAKEGGLRRKQEEHRKVP